MRLRDRRIGGGVPLLPPPPPVGYQGFGAGAVGGSIPYVVTSLADSGPGTLRDACSVLGRYIEFAVSGVIGLLSPIYVLEYTTIDGTTAPGAIEITSINDALVLLGEELLVTSRGSNIIVKGLRIRSASGDCIQIFRNSHDIVVANNDLSGFADGGIDITEGSFNITVCGNILNKTDPGAPGNSLQNYDVGAVTFYDNIYYGPSDRNPLVHGTFTRFYSAGPAHTDPQVDISNSIVWGYGQGIYIKSFDPSVATANVTNVLMQNDGATTAGNTIVLTRDDATVARAQGYIAGNVSVHDCRGTVYADGPDIAYTRLTMNDHNTRGTTPFPAPVVTGPAVTDQAGRLARWTAVKNTAGIIASHPDDAQTAALRAAIIIPAVSIFSEPWNDG